MTFHLPHLEWTQLWGRTYPATAKADIRDVGAYRHSVGVGRGECVNGYMVPEGTARSPSSAHADISPTKLLMLNDSHLYSEEPAKDVFSRSCMAIAEALKQQGYRYFKTKNRCTRVEGPIEYEIRFQSSHHNASGRHVQLWMHATVSSKELLHWRNSWLQPEQCSGHIAGGMVHLLGTRFALVQWELADPLDRPATISDAIAFLRDEVEPYFALFTEPETLIPSLACSIVPAFDLLGSVEYSYCFGGKSQAQQALDFFVSQKRAVLPSIGLLPPTEPNSMRHGDYSRQVAFLQRTYGFT